MCKPRLFVTSTWRRATVVSWLIGGSIGLGRRTKQPPGSTEL
jgi:hypothetical protein